MCVFALCGAVDVSYVCTPIERGTSPFVLSKRLDAKSTTLRFLGGEGGVSKFELQPFNFDFGTSLI